MYRKKKKRTKEEILGRTIFKKREKETEKANTHIKEELPNM